MRQRQAQKGSLNQSAQVTQNLGLHGTITTVQKSTYRPPTAPL